MMKQKYLIPVICTVAAALLIPVILFFIGSFGPGGNEENAEALADPLPLFESAMDAIDRADSQCYTVTHHKELIMGSEGFNQRAEQQIFFENLGAEDFRGSVSETLTIGDHTVTANEIYDDGIGYFSVQGGNFSAEMTAEDFLNRYTPMMAVTPELYKSITGTKTENGTTIHFIQAEELEPWLQKEGATFLSSKATVYITNDGKLEKEVYHATYSDGEIFIRQTITISQATPTETSFSIPDVPHIRLEAADAPKLLEIACGQLLEATSVTADYSDLIHCQAFGDLRKQTIQINTVQTDIWRSSMDRLITVENTGNVGAVSSLHTKELFDGTQQITTENDGDPVIDSNADIYGIQSRCRDMLVGTLLLPEHIAAATIEEDEDTLTVRYTANEDFAQILDYEAYNTLYQDTDILRQHAQDVKTDTITSYLTIQKSTGLPIAAGFCYIGIYTIDGVPYTLEFSADQTYQLIHDAASKNIQAELDGLH